MSLTEKAEALLVPGRAVMTKGSQEAVAGFSELEVETLVKLLTRVIENLEQE